MKVGYIRISTEGQAMARRIDERPAKQSHKSGGNSFFSVSLFGEFNAPSVFQMEGESLSLFKRVHHPIFSFWIQIFDSPSCVGFLPDGSCLGLYCQEMGYESLSTGTHVIVLNYRTR